DGGATDACGCLWRQAVDGGATDACGCLWRQAVFQRLFAALVNPDAQVDGGATDACGCLWRQAVFQRLFAALVNPDAQARAAGCRLGAAHCRYEMTLTPQEGRPPCTPPPCTQT
ncbi:MAG: hypothetical protein COW75_01415, partial [Rhodobacterales bacterium CG18_big_fil_WC_8_21_14_2_50_71_9]